MCSSIRILIFICLLICELNAIGKQSKCENFVSKAAWKDHHTIVETNSKMLTGIWISEGCETRPGPEYVIRIYTFYENSFFNLIQHHYHDDSCSSPKLTIIAKGRLLLRTSTIQPGAFNGYPKYANITVIPQDQRAVKELDQIVSVSCPNQYWKSWRRYEEHLVFDNKNEKGMISLWASTYQHLNSPKGVHHSAGDINCLGFLKWTFNELKLLKIQFRPVWDNFKNHPREIVGELLLGDIHSTEHLRQFHMSTSFQVPLIKQTKNENIILNKQIYILKNSYNLPNKFFANNGKTPPHLIEKPHLPAYIWGKWVSTRCEIRPMSLYLTRSFTFNKSDSVWIGEHKFFSDPFCIISKFIVTASGHFNLKSPTKKGITDIDFHIEKATLTVIDQNMIYDMKLPGFCGNDKWKINVPKDLGSTGCIYLGIVIPSTLYDIVKVEINYEGSWLLFLGQPDTNNAPGIDSERPTAFQAPLIKCRDVLNFSENLKIILEDGLFSNLGKKFTLTIPLYFIFVFVLVLR